MQVAVGGGAVHAVDGVAPLAGPDLDGFGLGDEQVLLATRGDLVDRGRARKPDRVHESEPDIDQDALVYLVGGRALARPRRDVDAAARLNLGRLLHAARGE